MYAPVYITHVYIYYMHVINTEGSIKLAIRRLNGQPDAKKNKIRIGDAFSPSLKRNTIASRGIASIIQSLKRRHIVGWSTSYKRSVEIRQGIAPDYSYHPCALSSV